MISITQKKDGHKLSSDLEEPLILCNDHLNNILKSSLTIYSLFPELKVSAFFEFCYKLFFTWKSHWYCAMTISTTAANLAPIPMSIGSWTASGSQSLEGQILIKRMSELLGIGVKFVHILNSYHVGRYHNGEVTGSHFVLFTICCHQVQELQTGRGQMLNKENCYIWN